MKVQEVAKNVMTLTHTTQSEVAAKSGLARQSSVGMYLRSGSMRVESLLTIMDACGYEVVVRDKKRRLPEFVIGDEPEVKVTDDEELEAKIRRMVAEEMKKAKAPGSKKK